MAEPQPPINICGRAVNDVKSILPHAGGHSFTFPTTNILVNIRPIITTTITAITTRLDVANPSSIPRDIEATNSAINYSSMTTLPRHPNNDDANKILSDSKKALGSMQERVLFTAAAATENEKNNPANNAVVTPS